METATMRTLEGIEAPAPGTWELDPAHTSVEAVARHLMVTKVRGRFGSVSGTIHVADRIEDSWVEATIDAASIDTGNAQRDAHLRSPDFLDVENHPTIAFRSTRVARIGERDLRVEGNLTLRGATRPVVLGVTYEGLIGDTMGGTRTGFSARTELNREDFGMTWNQALETGGVVVGKTVQIELDIQAVAKVKDQASAA